MGASDSVVEARLTRPGGRRYFFIAIAAVVVGAIAWWLLQPAGPIGKKEDPARIIVVKAEDGGEAGWLGELGFHGEYGTLDASAARAAEGGDDKVAAVLRMADEQGIGYVAFEIGEGLDLGGLDLADGAPDLSSGARFVVVSAGELAFPTVAAIAPIKSSVEMPARVELLQALFQHERLKSTLYPPSQLPINAVELHRQVLPAIEVLGAHEKIHSQARGLSERFDQALVENEELEPKPMRLGRNIERSKAIALADGGVLAFIQDVELESAENVDVELRYSPEIAFAYHAAGQTDPEQRTPCTALRGGQNPRDLQYRLGPLGDALLIKSGNGLEVWTLDRSGQCALQKRGRLPLPDDPRAGWGEVHGSGRVLRPALDEGQLILQVWTPGAESPEIAVMGGCTNLGRPIWLDDDHVAVSCLNQTAMRLEAPEQPEDPSANLAWLYLAELGTHVVVGVPSVEIDQRPGHFELWAVPGGDKVRMIARHHRHNRLALVELGIARTELWSQKPDADSLGPWFAPESNVIALPADTVSSQEIDRNAFAKVADLAVSPDGKRLALEVREDWEDDYGQQLAVVGLDPLTKPSLVVKNWGINDVAPMFTADSRSLVWTARFFKDEQELWAARILPLP